VPLPRPAESRSVADLALASPVAAARRDFRPSEAVGSPLPAAPVMVRVAQGMPRQVDPRLGSRLGPQGIVVQSLPIDAVRAITPATPAEAPSLREVLAHPALLGSLSPREWDLVLRQARAAALAARLSYLVEEHGVAARIPPPVRRHLDAERLMADKLAADAEREVRLIVDPLLATGVPVVLLKGAAYIVGALPAARGRVFSDIDILVPRAGIAIAERRLLAAGWEASETDDWDQRFYRQWMHEIPPMVHSVRETVLDLHFTIVPTKARIRLDPELLFAAALPGVRNRDVKILSPPDMVLHSATHLFNEGDFDRGLRDLVDLDLLLRHFGAGPEFWPLLADRAERLGLGGPLYYALRYTGRFLGTPIPPAAIAAARRFAPGIPVLMDALFEQALRPAHHTAHDRATRAALTALFVRAHHLRLPLHLLAPHLLRKAVIRLADKLPFGRAEAADEQSDA
jgi:Uncharacterised nucleotidyltransferase